MIPTWVLEAVLKEERRRVAVKTVIQTFCLMALVQFISYTNLTVNYRAIAGGHIPAAMTTDALAGAISYFIIRKVAKDDSGYAAFFGLVVGGSLAALVGITFTRGW